MSTLFWLQVVANNLLILDIYTNRTDAGGFDCRVFTPLFLLLIQKQTRLHPSFASTMACIQMALFYVAVLFDVFQLLSLIHQPQIHNRDSFVHIPPNLQLPLQAFELTYCILQAPFSLILLGHRRL
jgi:hypothetical protein